MTPARPRATCLAVLLLVAACGRGEGTPPSTGSHPPVFRPPGPFYQPPDPLPPGAAGQLIRSEPINAPAGYQAWRILYHSRTPTGADLAVSGLVAASGASPPPAGRPVLAYAHGVRGLARLCAPSNSTEPLDALPMLAPLLRAGAVLVATDYPGLGAPGNHPYLDGDSEARSVLDAVRAARQLAGLGVGTDAILFGDTQGGHAALFGGQIASAYSPELHVLGVAAEDPPTDLVAFERRAATTPFGVEFLMEATAGYAAGHPAADVRSILTPQGLADLDLLHTECDDEFGRATAGQAIGSAFSQSPIDTPPWSAGLAADSPGATRTPAPILISQGSADVQYPADLAATFVQRICAVGDTVSYRTYPQIGHAVTIAAAPDIVAWMADRLAGRPAPTSCQ